MIMRRSPAPIKTFCNIDDAPRAYLLFKLGETLFKNISRHASFKECDTTQIERSSSGVRDVSVFGCGQAACRMSREGEHSEPGGRFS